MLQVRRLNGAVRMLAVFAGPIAAASVLAAPAQADTTSDAFLDAVNNAGLLGNTDPANVVAVGQSICPMLSDPGQNAADIAAKVADSAGMSLGGANLFTGIAISFFCPRVVESIGGGRSPIPLSILGF